MKFFKRRYRLVFAKQDTYYVQYKKWWMPFWAYACNPLREDWTGNAMVLWSKKEAEAKEMAELHSRDYYERAWKEWTANQKHATRTTYIELENI